MDMSPGFRAANVALAMAEPDLSRDDLVMVALGAAVPALIEAGELSTGRASADMTDGAIEQLTADRDHWRREAERYQAEAARLRAGAA